MILTKKEAIGIAIELWTWLAETGEISKMGWSGWDKYWRMLAHCPLCEYADRKATRLGGSVCGHCLYHEAFGNCCDNDSPYSMWCSAETIDEKKNYASLFIEQLKQL